MLLRILMSCVIVFLNLAWVVLFILLSFKELHFINFKLFTNLLTVLNLFSFIYLEPKNIYNIICLFRSFLKLCDSKEIVVKHLCAFSGSFCRVCLVHGTCGCHSPPLVLDNRDSKETHTNYVYPTQLWEDAEPTFLQVSLPCLLLSITLKCHMLGCMCLHIGHQM